MLFKCSLSGKWSGRMLMIVIMSIQYLSISVSASEWSIVPTPNIDNVQFNTIHGDTEQNIFIGGGNGTVLFYNGNSWQQNTQFTETDIMVIRGESATGFFATGFNNETEVSELFAYTNNEWHALENPTDCEGILYFDIHNNPQDVFVVGFLPNMASGANMMASINGMSITFIDSPDECFYCFFKGIWGLSSDNLFLLSLDYQYPSMMLNIYQYNGTEFLELTSYEANFPENMPIGGIWGSSDTNIYVVNKESIIHFNGLEWTSLNMNQNESTYELLKVWGRASDDIFVSGIKNGTGGVIFHFNGQGWREMSLPDECLNSPVSEIWGTENVLYALGQTGFLMTSQKPLHLSLPSQANESDGMLINSAIVWIDSPIGTDLTITLSSDNTSELTIPVSIILPAGLTQVTFDMTVVDDSSFDGTQNVRIKASAQDFGDATFDILINDNEKATLSLTIPEIASESDNVLLKHGKISCNITVEQDISVQLISSDPSEIMIPEQLIIKAGQNSAEFDMTIIDDNEFDSTQTVSLTALVDGWISSCQQILVEDNELKSLSITVSSEIYEDDSPLTHQGKVIVPGILKENFTVYLISEYPEDLTCPKSVTIPSEYSFTTFYLVATDDTITDESQSIVISATAIGWNSITQTVHVLNNDPGYIQFKHDSYTVDANYYSISISVIRTRSHFGTISVDYYTTDGSAKAGQDYTKSIGTLVFNDGEYLKNINIGITQTQRLWQKNFCVQLTYQINGSQQYSSDKTTIHITSQKQWQWFYPKLTGNTINRIWGMSENSLFGVGENGTLIHYDGSKWSLIDYHFSNDLNAIWGADENNVFVVGDEGLIFHYDGHNWKSMPNPAHGNLEDIWGTSSTNIYVCGQAENNYGIILHYDGNYWSESIDRLPVPISSISGRNDNDVYAVGASYDYDKNEYRGIVFNFNGHEWCILKEFMSNLNLIITDENNLMINGDSEQIHEYDGNQWTISTINQPISRIMIDKNTTAYFLSYYSGRIYEKIGDQWSLYVDCSIDLTDFWMNDLYIFGVGKNGTILQIDRNNGNLLSNSREFQINDMWSQSQTINFAATSPDEYSSYLLTYDGNHQTETLIYSHKSFLPITINKIWGRSDNTFYTFFSDGSIYYYDGLTLSKMTDSLLESYESVMDVWGGSDNNIYAITSRSSIIHLNGTEWKKIDASIESGWTDNLSIWSDDGQNVYVTSNTHAYHFDGAKWSDMNLTSSINDVFGINNGDIFFSSCNEIIQVNGNEHKSMAIDRQDYFGCLHEIWGTNIQNLFSGGSGGLIFFYEKGLWNEMTTPVDISIEKLWGDPLGFDVYALLSNNTVMCYTRDFLLKYGQLNLDIPETTQETDGQIQKMLSISKVLDTDLSVSIKSSNPSAIIVPDTVIIEAGSTAKWFHMTIVDNSLINGDQSITITASAPDWVKSQATITVIDNESESLSLLLPDEVNEADGILNQQGQLCIYGKYSEDISVLLVSSYPNAISVSSIVSIPKGLTQTAFDLYTIDNDYLDTPLPVTITASIPQWMTTTTGIITVLDNESHVLSVSIPHQVSETDGLLSSQGQITIGGRVYKDLVVNLSSSRPEIINVPSLITIPAGQNSQFFDIRIIYHSDCGDFEDIVIQAESAELFSNATIHVKDNEGTCIDGIYYSDIHLTQFQSPYYVRESLYIRSTMTIDPGVIIKFSPNTGLFVEGSWDDSAIIAEGTSELPIVFTSVQDTPAPGDWLGIYFGSKVDNETTRLKHCIIEYAGQDANHINGNIEISNSAPTITYSIISNSLIHGIHVNSNTKPVITNNIFNENNGSIISVSQPNNLNFIEDNTAMGNSDPCIRLSSGYRVYERNIWKKNNDIPYVIETYVVVYNNSMLIIEDGVTLKFEKEAGIEIHENSSLIAQGTSTYPIIFTSNAIVPAPYDWKGINLIDSAPSCIEHCLIEYGGNNGQHSNIFSKYSKKIVIQNNTIRYSNTGIFIEPSDSDIIQCNQIKDNDIGVRIKNNDFSIHFNNIFNNQSYALYQDSDHIVNATNNYWGDRNGPGQTVNALWGNILFFPFLTSESICENITKTNYAPFVPDQPVPENDARHVQLSDQTVLLKWTGGDPNLWDSVVYDVYFGENAQNLSKIANEISNNSYLAEHLEPGKKYYWQIVSKDISEAEISSPVWLFVTRGDQLPDLIVSQITQSPETDITCGTPITFTAIIQNIGEGPLVDPVYVFLYINDSYIKRFTVDSILLFNESVPLTYVWKSEVGEKNIKIVINYYSDIDEKNEENNTLQQPIGFISDTIAPYLSYAYPKHNESYREIQFVRLEFKDDHGGTLNTSAIANSIMISCGNQKVEGTIDIYSSNEFRFIPESAPLTNGQYIVSCTAIDMAGNKKNEQLTFFIDQTPPHQPIIIGGKVFSGKIQPQPFENLTEKECFYLEGYSEESLDCQILEYHPYFYDGYGHYSSFNVSGNWSKRMCVYEGLTKIRIRYEDLAGNDSPDEWVDMIYDTITPEIISITPVHNSFMATPPECINIQFKEDTSGISMYSSTVQVKTANQAVVQGERTITSDSTITYTPIHAFSENLYFISVILVDRLNHQSSPQIIEFTVDATPAPPPGDLDYPSITPVSTPVIKGSKETWASIWLNGQLIVDHTPSLFWEYTLTVQSGSNSFTLCTRDRAGNKSENVFIDITYDDTPPPPIDHIMVNNKCDGKTLYINWSTYDASRAGDIALYDIYLETVLFDDLSSLIKYDTVSSDTQHYTFTYLNRKTSYYIAIIPKDIAGAMPATYTPITVTPMDVISPENVNNLHADIFRTKLCFTWEPSINSDNDLMAYMLLLNNEKEPITLAANIHAYTLTKISPSTEYTLTVFSVDNDHNMSSGTSLTIVTLLDNPTFTVKPHDQSIDVQWSQVCPKQYVKHYAIYVESHWYTSTHQLTPFLITQNLSAFLTNLDNYQAYYIAVGTVNVSGGQPHAITPVLARPSTEVMNVYANYPSPCQSVDDYQLTLEFSASMNISKEPLIEMISSAGASPTVYSGGSWKTTRYQNDTYVTSHILLSAQMAGEIVVNIVTAMALDGFETIPQNMAYTFVLNVTVPDPPVLSLQKLTQDSTIICWEYDVLSKKIAWFYMYRSLSPFNDLTAVSPVAISDNTIRCFDFGDLERDQSYYIAVVPRDVYGNMAQNVIPEELRISGMISFNRDYYTLTDSPIISYSDTLMNQQTERIDNVVLTLSSDSDPTGITLLFETHTNSSVFTSASITPQPSFSYDLSSESNHMLHVSNGDTIRVSSNNLSSLSYQGYAVMDCEPSLSELHLSGLYYEQDNRIYVIPQTAFSISATDTGSGVADIRCSMDGGLFNTCPQSITFQTEGFHHLIFQSDDIAGNIETAHHQEIIVDTIPPEPPDGISSSQNGYLAIITWHSNPEPDVSKYYLYKNGMRKAPEETSQTYFQDTLIAGRRTTYYITAMDRLNNESLFSSPEILTLPGNMPEITQPDSGVYLLTPVIKLSGQSDPGAIIDIHKNNQFYGTTSSNDSGRFHFFSLQLDEGINRISALATTSYGVRSQESLETIIYFFSNPSMVTGLAAESMDTMINLTWSPVIDQSVVGFRVYRDGLYIGDAMHHQNSFMDKCLTNGKLYEYQLSTMNENGMEGPPGDAVMARPHGEWQ